MGLRFSQRKKLLPGLTLNLSKSGASLSLGRRGAKVTVGPRGTFATIGLPGSGLSYTQHIAPPAPKKSSKKKKSGTSKQSAAALPAATLPTGFFERLMIPAAERQLIDGLQEFVAGRHQEAAARLARSEHPDARFLHAAIVLQQGDIAVAIPALEAAVRSGPQLGTALQRYGIEASFLLPITEELDVRIFPNEAGALLTLAEAYQWAGRGSEALEAIERLIARFPGDIVLRLSWIELLHLVRQGDPEAAQVILSQTVGIPNETAIHAGCLLYRARAMRQLGLLEEARLTLTEALRRKANRPQDLLLALHYERAMVFEMLGDRTRARKDLHAINALDSHYEDVGMRLGLPAGS